MILDTTVSELEAARTNPPLPQNGLGLPASPTLTIPNVALRIPTVQDASIGQLAIVRNATGNGVSFSGSGPTDPTVETRDVVRAFRSGNNSDQSHGFLFDDIKPRIVGTQPSTILAITAPDTLTLQFTNLSCRAKLKEGDVIQQPGLFGQVTVESGQPDGTGTVVDVKFTIIHADLPGDTLKLGAAQISSPFDGQQNALQEACFIRFTNIGQPPAATVALDSSVVLRFSEPMDPVTVRPFDSFVLKRITGTPTFRDFVPARITPSADLHQFTLTPALPLRHLTQGPRTPLHQRLERRHGPDRPRRQPGPRHRVPAAGLVHDRGGRRDAEHGRLRAALQPDERGEPGNRTPAPTSRASSCTTSRTDS